MKLLRVLLVSSLTLLALADATGSSAPADVAATGDTPNAGARLFPAGRFGLGTGREFSSRAFGSSVLVREEPDGSALALVGCMGEDDERGAVYVFERGTATAWRWVQTLLPDDFADYSHWPPFHERRGFGASLALDGDRLLVGAPLHHTLQGAAYALEQDASGRWLPAGQLVPTHPREWTNLFGNAVALDGDTALVGTVGVFDGNGMTSDKSVYVFERDDVGGWRQVQRIASHRFTSDWASAVALEGDVAVIGAAGTTSNPGRATLYTRGADGLFQLTTELQPERAHLTYGRAVAVDDGTVAVGAYNDWYGGAVGGSVYTFTQRPHDVWRLAQQVLPSKAPSFSGFGWSIALDGDRLAVGAPDRADGAYVFRRDSGPWRQALELTVPEPLPRSSFGRAVALSGDTLLVGDPADTGRCLTADGCFTGAAHAYRITGATTSEGLDSAYEQKLMFTASAYGETVAADDDLVVVGDGSADDACPEDPDCNSGAVHILESGHGDGWIETQRITPADLEAGALFGRALARDGGWLAVGAAGPPNSCWSTPCSWKASAHGAPVCRCSSSTVLFGPRCSLSRYRA